jgi:hypothetical protein
MSCNLTQNYNTPTYTDYEMNMYSTYMLYVEAEVSKSNIPVSVKKEMMEKRHLHKKNNGTIWYLEEEGYEVEFIPFKSWLTQTEREQKLEQLLNG